jgi:hypothetical protein
MFMYYRHTSAADWDEQEYSAKLHKATIFMRVGYCKLDEDIADYVIQSWN